MKCKLCGKYFSYDIKFNNLFKTIEVCETCNTYFTPKLSEEIIPIDRGFVRYIYLYDEIKMNQIQKEYLSKNLHILYEEIQKYRDCFILIIDDLNYKNLENKIQLLLSFKKVVFVSLLRYNIEKYVYFF